MMTASTNVNPQKLEDIRTWLITHIADYLNISSDEIDENEPFESFGLSSTEMVMISGDLEEWLEVRLEPTLVWQYPTINLISRYLVGEKNEDVSIAEIFPNENVNEPIAVIGIGCRFPGGDGPDGYWDVLINGVDAITETPLERWDNKIYYDPGLSNPGSVNTRWGGFLQDVDLFDNELFKISPREAISIDPQQRLLLEVTWEALEHAGQAPEKLAGSSTGIFVGISTSDYSMLQFSDPSIIDAYAGTGNAHSVAANRLSYFFDFQGPSIALDTACSSSLVSIHLAVQSLRNGECAMALAGGVNLLLSPELTVAFSQARMLAPDGRCKTFDASADGYVRGEGCGMVVLKRLSDAQNNHDNVLGIIRGSAINHDGKSNGLTAPNGLSQQAVIRKALTNASLEPGQISYLEAHGTGTPLGDPIEFDALKAVFKGSNNPNNGLTIGSAKTNIGHLEAAAGIAGFIKVLLALKNEVIPPHLHLKEINPQIDLEGTSFNIPSNAQAWPAIDQQPRYAGVSSFGFGGTNAHVILEGQDLQKHHEDRPVEKTPGLERPLHVLSLSARDESRLRELSGRYITYLESELSKGSTISDICYTANTGRQQFESRLAVFSDNRQDIKKHLTAFITGKSTSGYIYNQFKGRKPPHTAYLFTGQGAQYIGMGRELYDTEPTFRNIVNECDAIAEPYLENSLLSVIFSENENQPLINETAYTQPALFTLEYALASLLMEWGVQPNLVLGHSIGEYAAACFAGAFSLKDGLKLVLERGRLMQSLPRDGSMTVVFAELEQVAETIKHHQDRISIATVNGPTNIVISGETNTIKNIVLDFEKNGVECRSIEVSHAFHSPLMDPILEPFRYAAEKINYQPLRYPLASNLSGQIIQAGEVLSADYWVQHIRQPVLFASGMDVLAKSGVDIFVEIGPSPVLLGMGKRFLPGSDYEWLPTLRKGKPDWRILLNTLGMLYTKGTPVDWAAFDRNYERQRVPLPTYPFAQKRFWFDVDSRRQSSTRKRLADDQAPTIEWLNQLVWKQVDTAQPSKSTLAKPIANIIFADEEGLGVLLAEKFQEHGEQCTIIFPGEVFKKAESQKYFVNPTLKKDFIRLFDDVLTTNSCRIIHLWSLNSTFLAGSTLADLQDDLDLSCAAALNIIQALADQHKPNEADFSTWFITQGSQQVGAEPSPISISQAPLWGLARTIALEYPELWGGLIDLDPSAAHEALAQIWHSFQSPDKEDQIAFRSGRRYAARIEPIQDGDQSRDTYNCNPDASYLITGGTGALGFSVARRLIERGARHLILASRTEFPPQSGDRPTKADDALTSKMSLIKELEDMGAHIYLVPVDVADEDQMATLFQDGVDNYPPIRGVIHMAGVVEPQTIRQLTVENLSLVMRPKVMGTWLLHELLGDTELDFFVLFSSAASVLNSPMLGSYAAANAFLDAMAHYRGSLHKTALSINWGFWSGGGMALQYQESMGRTLVPKGMEPIPTKEGLDILEGLFNSTESQVGVMPIDWQEWSRYQPRIRNLPLLSSILGTPELHESTLDYPLRLKGNEVKQTDSGDLFSLPPEQWGDYLADYIKQTVANALLMEAENIASDQNLMELGIDSLMVMELTGNLERDFQITVYPREVFERPSIRSFAEYLESEIKRLHPEKMGVEKGPSEPISVADVSMNSSYLGIPVGIGDYHQPLKKNPKAAFILSSPRTGSTLLRVMLAGHPDLFCPPELHLLPFENMKSRHEILGESYLDEGLTRALMEVSDFSVADGKALIDDWTEKETQIEEVYEYLQKRVDSQLLIDKSPSYAISLDAVERAEILFDCPKYIFLSRHPYAVIESFIRNRIDKLIGIESGSPLDIAEYIWATMNANVLDFFRDLEASRYHIIKYEDLVAEPAKEMKKISDFLELKFNEAVLKPYDKNRMTDGLYEGSRPIGDPNFLKHEKVEPKFGEIWKEINLPRRLGGFAKRVAQELKYELPDETRKSALRKTSGESRTQSPSSSGITSLSRDRHRMSLSGKSQTQSQPGSGITPLSRDMHRLKSSDPDKTETNNSLKDELL